MLQSHNILKTKIKKHYGSGNEKSEDSFVNLCDWWKISCMHTLVGWKWVSSWLLDGWDVLAVSHLIQQLFANMLTTTNNHMNTCLLWRVGNAASFNRITVGIQRRCCFIFSVLLFFFFLIRWCCTFDIWLYCLWPTCLQWHAVILS